MSITGHSEVNTGPMLCLINFTVRLFCGDAIALLIGFSEFIRGFLRSWVKKKQSHNTVRHRDPDPSLASDEGNHKWPIESTRGL